MPHCLQNQNIRTKADTPYQIKRFQKFYKLQNFKVPGFLKSRMIILNISYA